MTSLSLHDARPIFLPTRFRRATLAPGTGEGAYAAQGRTARRRKLGHYGRVGGVAQRADHAVGARRRDRRRHQPAARESQISSRHQAAAGAARDRRHGGGGGGGRRARRSEEHTSELQSLMRISYAVFCLKQKNTKTR